MKNCQHICERDTLTKADKLCDFYLKKMKALAEENHIMKILYDALFDRLTERRCKELIGLARYFESGKNYSHVTKESLLEYPSKRELVIIATELYDRLYGDIPEDVDQINVDSQPQPAQNISEEDELMELLSKDEMDYGKKKLSTRTLIEAEMSLFERDPKNEQPMLKKLKKALMSCVPTSVEPERAFSSCAVFINKFRTKLLDDIINHMIVVRAFLKRAKNK